MTIIDVNRMWKIDPLFVGIFLYTIESLQKSMVIGIPKFILQFIW